MGYYSNTAYAVVFHTEADKNKVFDTLTPEQQKIVRDDAAVFANDRIYFHSSDSKWYSTRLIYSEGFADVDAHEAFLKAAEDAFTEWSLSDGQDGVESLGVFMRMGEDDDDFERTIWGEGTRGLPDWYELVDSRRELVVGWE